ncbi:MAG: segregation/condensation protein A [Anaerolineae bacterium]
MSTLPGLDTSSYHVTLPVFEGPLDLLLHLIEREEMDITQVSLAQVTNQYLEYLARISERDPDNLADFLVVAAKLLLIKSRVLLPQPPRAAELDEDDVGEDLVRQLIEYKKFKEMARWLEEVGAQGHQSYVRLAGTPPVERVVDLGEVSIEELLAAVRQALAIKPPQPLVDRAVAPITITIADQMGLIERRTAGGARVRFLELLEKAQSRLEVIVTLLALLEMVKQLRISVVQDRTFGEIWLEGREGVQAPERAGAAQEAE